MYFRTFVILFTILFGLHPRLAQSARPPDTPQTANSPKMAGPVIKSLASGDLNGDGFHDLVIGVPSYDAVGAPLGGKVYLLFGHSNFPDTLQLNALPSGVTIYAPAPIDLGASLRCGDLNGDGLDDLLMGAPFAAPANRRDAGLVYYLRGRRAGFPTVIDLNQTPVDGVIWGKSAGDALGSALALGDVNQDGMTDLILGAFKARRPDTTQYLSGSVFVILNQMPAPAIEDLALPIRRVVQIFGEFPNDFCGSSVACRDVTGDSIVDIIIGAYKANLTLPDCGKAYLIQGRSNFYRQVYLDLDSADVQFLGAQFQEHLAYALVTADLNADGWQDLIFGCRQASSPGINHGGGVRVVWGKPSFSKIIDFSSIAPDWEIYGAEPGGMLGKALSTGDVNGDGITDLVVAAPFSELNVPTPPGRVYLCYGSPDLAGRWEFANQPPAQTFTSTDTSDNFGASLTCADLNGDRLDDIIVAAPCADAGRIYVFWGHATTDVEPAPTHRNLPFEFDLRPGYPNPWQTRAHFQFHLDQPVHLQLTIFTVLGECMVQLMDQQISAGLHQVDWDGRDASGKLAPNGIYFYQFTLQHATGILRRTYKFTCLR